MKQMLLRVDDDLHGRLSARARQEHRSLNALANELLKMASDLNPASPRDRFKARAVSLGMLATPLSAQTAPSSGAVHRDRVIEQTRGWEPVIDEILDADRDRR